MRLSPCSKCQSPRSLIAERAREVVESCQGHIAAGRYNECIAKTPCTTYPCSEIAGTVIEFVLPHEAAGFLESTWFDWYGHFWFEGEAVDTRLLQ